MTAAIVAAVAALSGVAIGKLLDAFVGTRSFRNEHRAGAYGAFMGAAQGYRSGLGTIQPGDFSYGASAQGLELDRAHGDLLLYGSDRADELSDAMLKTLEQIGGAFAGGPMRGPASPWLGGYQSLDKIYLQQLSEFREVARSEVRVR